MNLIKINKNAFQQSATKTAQKANTKTKKQLLSSDVLEHDQEKMRQT